MISIKLEKARIMTVPEPKQNTYLIQGLDCADCARKVENGVTRLETVEKASINFTSARMTVIGESSAEEVINRVRALGYDAVLAEGDKNAAEVKSEQSFFLYLLSQWNTRLALIGLVFILPGLIFNEILGAEHLLINISSLIALAIAGFPIIRNAIQTLRLTHEISINLLMTIAAVGAVIIGTYTEAGMVMVLFAIGEALEGYTTQKARESIRSLMEVVPATALRRNPDGSEDQIGVEALQPGDLILIKPGERIAMDGLIIEGASAVNQAPVTGESALIEKQPGSEVFASTVNGEGTLLVQITHLAVDNTISRVIRMVAEAQEKRSPVQRFIDRFAQIYTPAVVGLATLVAIIPPLFFGQPFLNPSEDVTGWLYRGLALLVVACPCALVISTPVSMISAISNAARQGVLFKGGVHLETLSKAKVFAFDKTGTLTAGRPNVVSIAAANAGQNGKVQFHHHNTILPISGACQDCTEVLALAHAVERNSEHPLASAIDAEANRLGVQNKYPSASNVAALAGRGVMGTIENRQVVVGSHGYFEQEVPHERVACEAAEQDAAQGYTPVMVASEGAYLGTISLSDQLRPSSRQAVARLKELGIQQVVMLTGDHTMAAEKIASEAGLTGFRANLFPAEKVQAVEALRAQSGTLVMVGDGINDAPALATADVGIAMGGSGATAQAMETADITLMRADLNLLPFALSLSRATMQTIKANVIFAIGIKLVFMLLVMAGLGTMWMAVIADVGVSLLVTLNGMRMLRWHDREWAI